MVFLKTMRSKLLLCFTLLFSWVQAQQATEELAAQFYANGEYLKAADMYETLLGKNQRSIFLYDNLLNCYIKLSSFQDAQKLVKKQIKKNEQNMYFQVDYGYLIWLNNQKPDADKYFNELINKIVIAEPKINELAMAFVKRNFKSYAVQTYLYGRKNLKNNTLFCLPLAGLYADIGETSLMIDEYLNVLLQDNSQTDDVQGFLQQYVNSPQEFELLKQALIKKNRSYPDQTVFAEMLIWLYVQQKDFIMAANYARILDKRYKEQGRRLMDLGFIATANQSYQSAIILFTEVVQKGPDNPFYAYAKNAILEARSKKLLSGTYTGDDIHQLEISYKQSINEFGFVYYMAPTLRDLANLQAYYLNQYDSAISTYEKIISMPRVEPKIIAACKMDLADLYLYHNNVWDAMLLYGQVDKDFQEEPTGQEAKFRNARLSYFIGEFDWARAQLDVLKTATTQLIANNAIELSLLIQDNTVDSNDEPLRLFAKADLHYFQRNYNLALLELDSLSQQYPKHELTDDILFKKAQIFEAQLQYEKAFNLYELIFNTYNNGILGDNALYKMVLLKINKLNSQQEGVALLEKFISTYPGSFFLTEVTRQYRKFRGDQLN